MSIHPEVGPAVAREKDTVDYLLQILGETSTWFLTVLGEVEAREEMGEGRMKRERERES